MGKHTATLMMMLVQLQVLIILVFFSLKTPAEFEDLYAERAAAEGYNPYSRYGLSYDAMWAIAVGLDNALTRIQNNDTSGCEDVPGSLVPLEDFEYSNSKMGCVLRESYHQTNFSGVTVSSMLFCSICI